MKESISNKNISYKGILNQLKCVRCSSIKDLKVYNHKYRISSWQTKGRYIVTKSRTWNQEFPVCNNCFKKFKHWKGIDIVFRITILLLFSFFVIIILLDLITHNVSTVLILIQFIPILILLIIDVYFHRKHKKSKENPSYYMSSRLGAVRPENSKKWIPFAEWILLVLRERTSQGTIDSTFQDIIISYLMDYENKKSTYLYDKQTADQVPKVNEQELMDKVYNFLKSNSGKAFTLEAILNRLFDSVNLEIIEDILKKLVSKAKIKFEQKEDKGFYFF